MILTKKGSNHYLLSAENDCIQAALQENDERIVILTRKGWHALRALTPESRALKELVEALDGVDEDTRHRIRTALACTPELASAVQEAQVLVSRMDDTEAV